MPNTTSSPYLTHWIKKKKDPFETLSSILNSKRLNAGDAETISFTDVPNDSFSSSKGIFSQFGIQFDKKVLFNIGARPAIYLPDNELNLLPESLKWLHVSFDPNPSAKNNWIWQREWKLHENYIDLEKINFQIIVPTSEDCIRVQKIFYLEAEKISLYHDLCLGLAFLPEYFYDRICPTIKTQN